MDMGDLVLLTEAQKAEYRHWDGLFQHQGWKLLMSDLQETYDAIPEDVFATAESWDKYVYQKGVHDQLGRILRYEDFVHSNREADIKEAQDVLELKEAEEDLDHVMFDPAV